MPVTFHQIASNTARVTLVYGANTITIEYYPDHLTGKMRAEIEAGATTDDQVLIQLIKSWDVYEDDEQTVMFPIERMAEFGLKFKQRVIEAIVLDYAPNMVAPQIQN